jgi:hypothetical protein
MRQAQRAATFFGFTIFWLVLRKPRSEEPEEEKTGRVNVALGDDGQRTPEDSWLAMEVVKDDKCSSSTLF